MQDFIAHFSYLGVAFVLILGGLDVPIPEDLPLLTGGYLVGQGLADFRIMLAVSLASVIGGDWFVYFMGRRYGERIQRWRLFRRMLNPERLAKAEAAFHKHGGKTIFLARFLPGIRCAAFFTAGSFKIPAWKFFVFDGVAALISVPTIIFLGYYFHEHIEAVRVWISRASYGLAIVIVLCVAAVLAWRYLRRRQLASTV